MTTARKRSREELVSAGYCPECSKCTAQCDILERFVLHGCRKCGVLLIDASGSYEGPFIEITARKWEQIREWYDERCGELQTRITTELPEVVMAIVAGRRSGPMLV
jgi:hypothetical protein